MQGFINRQARAARWRDGGTWHDIEQLSGGRLSTCQATASGGGHMVARCRASSRHQVDGINRQATPSGWRMVARGRTSSSHQMEGLSTAKQGRHGARWWRVAGHQAVIRWQGLSTRQARAARWQMVAHGTTSSRYQVQGIRPPSSGFTVADGGAWSDIEPPSGGRLQHVPSKGGTVAHGGTWQDIEPLSGARAQHCQAAPSGWQMVRRGRTSSRYQVQGLSTAKPRLQGGRW